MRVESKIDPGVVVEVRRRSLPMPSLWRACDTLSVDDPETRALASVPAFFISVAKSPSLARSLTGLTEEQVEITSAPDDNATRAFRYHAGDSRLYPERSRAGWGSRNLWSPAGFCAPRPMTYPTGGWFQIQRIVLPSPQAIPGRPRKYSTRYA